MTVDLRTTYLGCDLAHPIVASAGPLSSTVKGVQSLARAGAAAIVLPSLFEEEIVRHDLDEHRLHSAGTGVFAEAFSYLPELPAPGPADRYLELVQAAVTTVDVPVIASLNGLTTGGWVRYATDIEAAGAAALELNVYVVASDPDDTAELVERRVVELVREVVGAVRIPVAVKLSPYFSALTHTARAVMHEGAAGLVLFNRFYQPDIDLSTLTIAPSLDLSTEADLRLPLRWVGILREHVTGSLALSGGVHSPEAAVKGILAGADVVMTTAALLRQGPEYLSHLRDGLATWFEENEYESVAQARGSMSRRAVPDPDEYERSNYLQVIRRATTRYVPPA
ncbi:MAG: dihydroorotate dehydrogenase-like protein [Ilumatobacteraceae bacterium]